MPPPTSTTRASMSRHFSRPLDHDGDALAHADAHRWPGRSGPSSRCSPCTSVVSDARAAGAERVPQRDRAAVHVHLRRVQAELADAGERLGRECLVQLDQVDVRPRGLRGPGPCAPPAPARVPSPTGPRRPPRSPRCAPAVWPQCARARHRPTAISARGPVVDAARRSPPSPCRPCRKAGFIFARLRGSIRPAACSSVDDQLRRRRPCPARTRARSRPEAARRHRACARALALDGEGVLIRASDPDCRGDFLRRFAERDGPLRGQPWIDEPPADRGVCHRWRRAIPGVARLEQHVRRARTCSRPRRR